MNGDLNLVIGMALVLATFALRDFATGLSELQQYTVIVIAGAGGVITGLVLWTFKSTEMKNRRKLVARAGEIPNCLKDPTAGAILGREKELGMLVSFPNRIRLRHTHILGATGAGKTESVILSLLGQDIERGYGAIILDGKGDDSFLRFLEKKVPADRLKVFDLGDGLSSSYDPMSDGSPAEAAQRLFSSLTWSEEYYKSKASTALHRIFQAAAEKPARPSIPEIASILASASAFKDGTSNAQQYSAQSALADYKDLSGLVDQVTLLASGDLSRKFSSREDGINLKEAYHGKVIYFRLQSLLSRQLAKILGRLVINHLSFLAGSAHRESATGPKFIPVYLDEFATFACPEFADLIAKARSAGLALHFSHQSVGDLEGVEGGFLSQIMDNSATKIILRVNDPDTAETFSRAFGTKKAERITKRVSNATDLDAVESDGMGSLREVREFRASPDLLKSLPTGVGAVLIAHGEDTPHGASTVFQIKFPKLSN